MYAAREIAAFVGIEVAVGALALAPGQVDIQTQGRQLHQRWRRASSSRALALARWLMRFFTSGAVRRSCTDGRDVEQGVVAEAVVAPGLEQDTPSQLAWQTSGVGSCAWRM